MLTISSGVRPPDNTPPWTTADQEELLGALDQTVGHQNEILGATCQLVEGRQMKTTGEVELVEETLSVQSLYNALQDLTQVISREGVFDSKEDARAVSLSGPKGSLTACQTAPCGVSQNSRQTPGGSRNYSKIPT